MILEGNNMGNYECSVIVFVLINDSVHAFLVAHSSPKYCVGVRESPYVCHPVCQMVSNVALAIV